MGKHRCGRGVGTPTLRGTIRRFTAPPDIENRTSGGHSKGPRLTTRPRTVLSTQNKTLCAQDQPYFISFPENDALRGPWTNDLIRPRGRTAGICQIFIIYSPLPPETLTASLIPDAPLEYPLNANRASWLNDLTLPGGGIAGFCQIKDLTFRKNTGI